jgi:glucosamine-6-phosphate deaminase
MSVIKYQFRDVEKIKTSIWQDARKGSIHIAQVIAQAIKEKATKGENILLGLSTGNSPIQVYKELVRMHKEEGLSFKNVIICFGVGVLSVWWIEFIPRKIK